MTDLTSPSRDTLLDNLPGVCQNQNQFLLTSRHRSPIRECKRWSLLSISRDIPTSSRAISAEPSLALSAASHITHEVRNNAIFRRSQS
jgi:hypothetical protein